MPEVETCCVAEVLNDKSMMPVCFYIGISIDFFVLAFCLAYSVSMSVSIGSSLHQSADSHRY